MLSHKRGDSYVEEHEHNGTIMSQYYKERVRTAVHSTTDNAMLKSDMRRSMYFLCAVIRRKMNVLVLDINSISCFPFIEEL